MPVAPPTTRLALVRSIVRDVDSDSADDRRLHIRCSISDLPWLDVARLKYGPAIGVIDLSRGGAQIETEGHRLQPGSTIVVELTGEGNGLVVPAQVLRCHVSRLGPSSATYRGALEFKRSISFPDVVPARRGGKADSPRHGPHRMSLAQERWSESRSGSGLLTPAGSMGHVVPAPAPDVPAPVESDLPSGWHRLVVRYADGRLLKGFSQEFTSLSGSLQVWPRPNAPVTARITVPLAHLKAVFFVRDFEGDPEHVERPDSESTVRGRRIAVTFLDGETLTGTTMNYRTDATGFFVQPLDDKSNNVRIFVASRAIRHVQFP